MTEYKKSAVVLVFNDKGELALQLRAAQDYSYPSHWDFAAGGGVDDGEDEKLAAQRELKEELEVEAIVEFVSSEHLTYPKWQSDVIREADLFIYKAEHNGPFTPNPNEVERVEFFSLETIKKMTESGARFHPEFKILWDKGIISNVRL